MSVATASAGGKVAWVVPEYKNGRPLWRWVEATLGPLRQARTVSINRAERLVEFNNGGMLALYSADNPDSIRGEWFHLVIVDEAARVAEEAWTDAIQPTLADVDGDAILISTPKGRNWFWREWQAGVADAHSQAAWKAPSRANPNPRIQAAAEKARTKVTSDTYRQEWEAEFIEGSGQVFRRIREAVLDGPFPLTPYTGTFIGGIDWGQKFDFTVITIMDAATRQVVDKVRLNKVDWAYQRAQVKELHARWGVLTFMAEANSIGMPNIEALAADNVPVFPFTTTNASKGEIIQRLIMDFEQERIGIPNDPNLISELEGFEQEQTPTGLMKYGAPAGMHDDEVMALALANLGCSGQIDQVIW